MRFLILIAGAAMSLAACGRNNQADTTTNASDGLTAESIVANDVTAIDAVTGDAANMAADVDLNFTNQQIAATARQEAGQPPQRRTEPATRTSPPASSSTTPSPTTNATTAPATNSTTANATTE